MKIVLFVAHPRLNESVHGSRMNKSMVEAAKQHSDVTVVDLSKDHNIPEHQKLMEQADRIVFQFPIYWFNMPGLAKQWIDDVLAHNWAYGDHFKLEGKEFLFAVTSGQPNAGYTSSGTVGVDIDHIFVSMKLTAYYCKMKLLPYFHIGNVQISDEDLKIESQKYASHIVKSF